MLRKFFNKVFGLASNNTIETLEANNEHEEETPDTKTGLPLGASLVFGALEDSDSFTIHCAWKNTNQINQLASLLYLVNSGQLEQSCISILERQAHEDPKNLVFLRDVFAKWQDLKRKNQSRLYIKPSEVFNLGRSSNKDSV